MKKRLLSLILAFTLIFNLSLSVLANEAIDIFFNGEELTLADGAYLEEGRVMVPIRHLVEAMGYQVEWDGGSRSVLVSKGDREVSLKIGSSKLLVNGEELELSTGPVLKNSRTYIPLELLSKAFDLVIGWDNKHRILNITEEKLNTEEIFKLSQEAALREKLDEYLTALRNNRNFQGSVLIAKDGELILSKGYGYSDVDQLTENKAQTKFAIGSVTKQFVAAGILMLEEEGLLSLEDPVSKYIPELTHGDSITLHQLLTHSSGLVNFTEIAELLMVSEEIDSPWQVLDYVKDKDLMFKAGEKFSYSNTNYLLLDLIIERVSGVSCSQFLKENIFKPLKMDNTGFVYEDGYLDATAYAGHLDVVPVDDEMVLKIAFGAGSMYSTVEDLYRWNQALFNGGVLKAESLEKAFAPHVEVSEGVHYGYGWMIGDLGFEKDISHGGNTIGFTAEISRLEELGLDLIILSNKGAVNTSDIKASIFRIILGEEVELPEPMEVIELEDAILDRYVGKYEFFPELGTSYIELVRADGKLLAYPENRPAFELYPQSETKFFATLGDIVIEFIIEEDGSVNSFNYTESALTRVCKRIVEEEREEEVVDIDPAVFEDYVGEYEIFPEIVIKFFTEEGKVYAQITGQPSFELTPVSENEFVNKMIDANISFARDEEGKVVELILKQLGVEYRCKRL